MKIFHMSDVHGDTESLERALEVANKNDADVVAITGDFLYHCLSSEETQAMHNALQIMNQTVPQNLKGANLKYLVQNPISSQDAPENFRTALNVYRELESLFDRNVQSTYEKTVQILKSFPKKVLTIPGNWDPKSFDDYFAPFNLHGQVSEIHEQNFAGYGGADVTPFSIPSTRTRKYSEDEMYVVLDQMSPEADIVLSHIPARFILDRADTPQGVQHIGSLGLLAYVNKKPPIAVLQDHAHDAIGIFEYKNGLSSTLFVNSGNVGRYLGTNHYGTFMEIEIDDKNQACLKKFYQINNDDVIERSLEK